MKDIDWTFVADVFADSLELPAAEREEFVAERCSGRPADRAAVERMLATRGDVAPGFLDEVDPDLLEEIRLEARQGGAVIGPWRLVREIGRGGMGQVFLAERMDGQFEQQVALKLLKRGMDSDAMLARFQLERQILARLQHPNIARLLDGGVTDDGRPYFVMDYIEGTAIDRHCDDHHLDLRRRLKLFLGVCAAVEFAHRNLIVHRDLKPSNILVTREGMPTLLDFGVAKILGPEVAPDAPLTRTGLLPMTPEYASPEQVLGEPLTTGSDVYSLGLILYELLTGHRPYRLAAASPHEVVETVCRHDPDPPSVRAGRPERYVTADGAERVITPEEVADARGDTPERLTRRLTGDLDAIVMATLRKDPALRYPSAEALARDVERHLNGVPVAALPAGRWYRARKFVRRHRVEAGAAVVAVVAVLAGAATAGWQALEASRERDVALEARLEAEASRDRAEEVTAALIDFLAASDPREAILRDTAAADALFRFGLARAEALEGQPQVQATLLDALGSVQRNWGDLDVAEGLIRRALALRRRTLGEQHPDVARSLNSLGSLARIQGRYSEAEALYREALDLQRRVLGEHHIDIAETLSNLANLAPYQGHLAASEELYARALEVRQAVLGADDPLVASSLTLLGGAQHRTGKVNAAEASMREALSMRKRLLGPKHPDVAESMLHLADLLHEARDQPAEAEELYRHALEIQKRSLGEEHPALSHATTNLARLLSERGDHEEAESLLRRLLELRRGLFGAESMPVAETLGALAAALELQGRYDDAEALRRQTLAMWSTTMGPAHQLVASGLSDLADLLVTRGEYTEAESLYRRSLVIRRAVNGEAHRSFGLTLAGLGWLHTLRGEFAPAESTYLRARGILRRETADAHPSVRMIHEHLAQLYERWGRADEARRYRELSRYPTPTP